jgi:imidazolonepropionase-like amidohydrolase
VEHSIWPQDPGLDAARQAGVTTLMVLPGSANLFGGRTVTLKNVPAGTMAGDEIPRSALWAEDRVWRESQERLRRQGAFAGDADGQCRGYRKAWIDAQDYARRWDKWEKGGKTGDPPKRDLQLETLVGVLKGEILVQNHCYRADEMANMIDIAREFRIPHPHLPPRQRGLQDRADAGEGGYLRRQLGELVGL